MSKTTITEMCTYRLPVDLIDRLDAEHKTSELSKTVIVRRAITAYLDKQDAARATADQAVVH